MAEKLDRYYRRHGCFPTAYTELVDVPEPNGTLPYSPDGRGDIHDIRIDDATVTVVVNAPDSLAPDTAYDWTEHEFTVPTHRRLRAMLQAGKAKQPTLHAAEHGYTIDLPIDIDEHGVDTTDERVLAVDLGVKKQATAVVLETDSDGQCARSETPSADETGGASGGAPSDARRPTAGVQSATDQQDQASGRQTQLSRFRLLPLGTTRDGNRHGWTAAKRR